MSLLSTWVVAASPDEGIVGAPPELTASDGRRTVLFDGRLYNRAALETELALPASSDRSDAEVILAAAERFGDGLPERIKGIYSLVVWNSTTRTLDAVRDPLGIRPLFHLEAGESTFLSNSIGALTSDPRTETQLSPIALAGLLANRLPDQTETPFAGVRRVPQGNVWRRQDGRTSLRRHWDPLPPDEPIRWAGPDELEQFDAKLETAVARTLLDGPAGIFLSGGIDSVGVAAYAADLERQAERPAPLALSLIFPAEGNEEGIQRAVAASLGLELMMLPLDDAIGPEGILGAGLTLASTWPMPVLNPWLPAYLRLGREAQARGCRAVLTGGGGDEWLSAGPYYAADLLRRFRLVKLVSFTETYLRSYPQSSRRLTMSLLWRFGLRPLLVDAARPWLERHAQPLLKARLARKLPDWIAPDPQLRRELDDRRPQTRAVQGGSVYFREGRRALEHPFVDSEMEDIVESGHRTGAEIRQPFWDADLLSLLYRIHPDDLSRGGRSKGLVREVIDRRFPECGFRSQRKVLVTNFFQDTMLRQGAALRKSVGPVSALTELGIVDGAHWEREFDRILGKGDRWQAQRIWDILGLEVWARSQLSRKGGKRQ